MSLVLPSESDSTLLSIENEEHGNASVVKGKGKQLERSKSWCDDQSYLSMLWPVNVSTQAKFFQRRLSTLAVVTPPMSLLIRVSTKQAMFSILLR